MAEIDEHIDAFEHDLGLPTGFYDRLYRESVDRKTFVLENPKVSIWLTGMLCVGSLYLQKELALLRQQAEQVQKEAIVKYIAAALPRDGSGSR